MSIKSESTWFLELMSGSNKAIWHHTHGKFSGFEHSETSCLIPIIDRKMVMVSLWFVVKILRWEEKMFWYSSQVVCERENHEWSVHHGVWHNTKERNCCRWCWEKTKYLGVILGHRMSFNSQTRHWEYCVSVMQKRRGKSGLCMYYL